jgi:hypothetical protein
MVKANELRLVAAKNARDLGATRIAFDAEGLVVAVDFPPPPSAAEPLTASGAPLEPEEAPKDETPTERAARVDRILFHSVPG